MCEVRIQPLLIWCHPREALLPSKLAREVLQLPAQELAAVGKVPSQQTRQDILQLLTQLRLARPDHLRLSLHHLLHLGGLQAANHLMELLYAWWVAFAYIGTSLTSLFGTIRVCHLFVMGYCRSNFTCLSQSSSLRTSGG